MQLEYFVNVESWPVKVLFGSYQTIRCFHMVSFVQKDHPILSVICLSRSSLAPVNVAAVFRRFCLPLSHWDPYASYAVRRGGCLELYYSNMVECFCGPCHWTS